MRESQLASHLIRLGDAVPSHLPGSSNLTIAGVRSRAFERLSETGLPKITDEAWRYTNIRPFDKVAFQPSEDSTHKLTESELNALEIESFDRFRLVLLDGWVSDAYSSLSELPDGVECYRLKDVLDGKVESRVVELLDARASNAAHGFEALNTAIAADGIVLHLRAGTILDKPLEILAISQSDTEALIGNVNHFISLEQGAKLDLVERYVSIADTGHMTNASIAFDLAESAEVNHYRIQNESNDAFHLGYSTTRQQQGSCYRIFSISMGSLLDRHEVTQHLEGEHSHCEVKGLYIGSGKQHIDNYTTIIHASAEATSDEFYKGILADRARSVFHGRIKVNPGAQHTDAQQQNRNLLLSAHAEADTKPQLEIYADDVKCSHGATVGYLDSDSIFYLRSRGLSDSEARAILTEAFAAEIVEQIHLPPIREHLLELLRNKLSDVHGQREAA